MSFKKKYFRLALDAVHRLHDEELQNLQQKLHLCQTFLEDQTENIESNFVSDSIISSESNSYLNKNGKNQK